MTRRSAWLIALALVLGCKRTPRTELPSGWVLPITPQASNADELWPSMRPIETQDGLSFVVCKTSLTSRADNVHVHAKLGASNPIDVDGTEASKATITSPLFTARRGAVIDIRVSSRHDLALDERLHFLHQLADRLPNHEAPEGTIECRMLSGDPLVAQQRMAEQRVDAAIAAGDGKTTGARIIDLAALVGPADSRVQDRLRSLRRAL